MAPRLSELLCIPCHRGSPPLEGEALAELQAQLPDWDVHSAGGVPRLERTFKFKDFAAALEFTNRVGVLAEAEDHHPALLTEWGKVTVSWWTHSIGGLHQNDFILAARTSDLYLE
jgi:4a-hydroxytetrahydrobiopterin dehydratase